MEYSRLLAEQVDSLGDSHCNCTGIYQANGLLGGELRRNLFKRTSGRLLRYTSPQFHKLLTLPEGSRGLRKLGDPQHSTDRRATRCASNTSQATCKNPVPQELLADLNILGPFGTHRNK